MKALNQPVKQLILATFLILAIGIDSDAVFAQNVTDSTLPDTAMHTLVASQVESMDIIWEDDNKLNKEKSEQNWSVSSRGLNVDASWLP